MLLRIVRLSFRSEKTEDFLQLFDSVSSQIRSTPGCTYLKLMRDHHQPDVFVTYSKWESQEDLDAYRESEFFSRVWVTIKLYFAEKPVAFSLEEYSGEIVP